MSVNLERFAQMSRFLDYVNRFDLLLQEKGEEVGLVRCSAEQLLEGCLIGIACHEGRAQTIHEDL